MTESPAVVRWRERVAEAAESGEAGDPAALRVLYAEAVVLFGGGAAHEWAEALSAFDASAQTG